MIKLSNQQQKVYDALDKNRGKWLRSDYFLYVLHLSQFHVRMTEMKEKGITIDKTPTLDEFGYRSYRLPLRTTLFN